MHANNVGMSTGVCWANSRTGTTGQVTAAKNSCGFGFPKAVCPIEVKRAAARHCREDVAAVVSNEPTRMCLCTALPGSSQTKGRTVSCNFPTHVFYLAAPTPRFTNIVAPWGGPDAENAGCVVSIRGRFRRAGPGRAESGSVHAVYRAALFHDLGNAGVTTIALNFPLCCSKLTRPISLAISLSWCSF